MDGTGLAPVLDKVKGHLSHALNASCPIIRAISSQHCRPVTPSIQSYTNHARKCVRSRSGTHGKISQHNSKNINKSYKHHNTSQGPRGLEYKCSIIDESAEATISEYRHKLNKFALRRLAQTGIQIERGAGLLPGILLNYSWSSSAACT